MIEITPTRTQLHPRRLDDGEWYLPMDEAFTLAALGDPAIEIFDGWVTYAERSDNWSLHVDTYAGGDIDIVMLHISGFGVSWEGGLVDEREVREDWLTLECLNEIFEGFSAQVRWVEDQWVLAENQRKYKERLHTLRDQRKRNPRSRLASEL